MATLENNLKLLVDNNPQLLQQINHYLLSHPNYQPTPIPAPSQAPIPFRFCKIQFLMGLNNPTDCFNFMSQHYQELALLIIIEKSVSRFIDFLCQFDFAPYFIENKIYFYIDQSPQNFKRIFIDLFLVGERIYYLKSMDVAVHPICPSAELNYYEQVVASLKEGMRVRQLWSTGDPEDSYIGLDNLLKNAKVVYQHPNIEHLQGKLKNIPGFAIASGPSLNASMHYLNKLNQKAVVMVVASLGKKFIENGINPHFISAIERGYLPATLFEGITNNHFTRLLSPPLVDPLCYQYFKGDKVTIQRSILLFDWFPSPYHQHRLGHTSATLAVFSLLMMGCNPIYLLGQDLAYDRNSKESHAEGIHHGKTSSYRQDILQWEKVQVADNQGGMITSNHSWLRVIETFEYLFKNNAAKVYNIIPKNMGAAIPGTEQIDPEIAFAKILSEQDTHPQNDINRYCRMQHDSLIWEQKLAAQKKDSYSELMTIKSYSQYLLTKLSSGIDSDYLKDYLDLVQGNPAKTLLVDIIASLHFDFMNAYYELTTLGLTPPELHQRKTKLFTEMFTTLVHWSERIANRLAQD